MNPTLNQRALATGLLMLFASICTGHTALNLSETFALERYTLIDDSTHRYETGNLLRNGTFRILSSSIAPNYRATADLVPISGKTVMYATLFNSYKQLGLIPHWVRSTSEYSVGFSTYVVVSTGKGSGLDPKPTFQRHPDDQQILVGENLVLAGVTVPSAGVAYQWVKNGRPIRGANSPVLRLTARSRSDSGRYALKATIGRATAVSRNAIVTVIEPVVITRDLKSTPVRPLRSVALAVQAKGTGPLVYQWFHNGSPILNATAARLLLQRIGEADAGDYYVRISNSRSAAHSSTAVVSLLR